MCAEERAHTIHGRHQEDVTTVGRPHSETGKQTFTQCAATALPAEVKSKMFPKKPFF